MNLGENIYRLRTGLNMSQGDLADALEVSRQSVSKWENNSAVPELDKLVKMAHIFGITLDEMVTEAEAPSSSETSSMLFLELPSPESAFLFCSPNLDFSLSASMAVLNFIKNAPFSYIVYEKEA